MKEELNISADFLTFNKQMKENYGDLYYEQSLIFFERATHLGMIGCYKSAIADGAFAYQLSKYSNEYDIIYILGFLSQIFLDNENIKMAEYYCNIGLKMLDENDNQYQDDLKSFKELEEMIRGESWKRDIN